MRPALGATLKVGPTQTYHLPSAAAAIAKRGDHIEISPGEYSDCAVLEVDDLTIEGTGPGVVIADRTCEGKGLLVITGRNTTVRRLTLARARVPDRNGAGIRFFSGNLIVDSVNFINNQDGILGNAPGAMVVIRNSTFEGNGFCEKDCAHAVYINDADILRIENSRFSNTRLGHSIKSRARHTEVIRCMIADGAEGTSSYLIDAPNGGTLIVRENMLEKGPKTQNRGTAITIGEEGVTLPTSEITITNNYFRNGGEFVTTFVRNMTATPAMLKANQLSGKVIPLKGDGKTQ